MARIFVSYRREDSAGHAGRVYDHLCAFFGPGRVFMDVEAIDPGIDFAQMLENRITRAEVVVVVIGRQWLSVRAPNGKLRLDDLTDYVRQEVSAALARDIDVIPVLVGGATMPRADQLPPELADLAGRQAYELRDGAFEAGMAKLLSAVERAAARTRERRRLSDLKRRPIIGKRLWWSRLFLLYEPSHPAVWLLHILFFALLVLALSVPPIIILVASGDGIILAPYSFVSLAFCLMIVRSIVFALEPDEVMSPLRRWLLLYNPPRASMLALHLLFYFMVLFTLLTGIQLFSNLQVIAEANLKWVLFAQAWGVGIVLTFIVREIAAARDPLKERRAERNWFARLLCVWKPRRAAAWLPRLMYYATLAILYFTIPFLFVDKTGHFGELELTQNRVKIIQCMLLLIIALALKGWSRAKEVKWPGRNDRNWWGKLRDGLLLYIPWRSKGWLATGFFWFGIVLLIGVTVFRSQTLAISGLNDADFTSLVVLSIALTVSAWGWAKLFRPPKHWKDET